MDVPSQQILLAPDNATEAHSKAPGMLQQDTIKIIL